MNNNLDNNLQNNGGSAPIPDNTQQPVIPNETVQPVVPTTPVENVVPQAPVTPVVPTTPVVEPTPVPPVQAQEVVQQPDVVVPPQADINVPPQIVTPQNDGAVISMTQQQSPVEMVNQQQAIPTTENVTSQEVPAPTMSEPVVPGMNVLNQQAADPAGIPATPTSQNQSIIPEPAPTYEKEKKGNKKIVIIAVAILAVAIVGIVMFSSLNKPVAPPPQGSTTTTSSTSSTSTTVKPVVNEPDKVPENQVQGENTPATDPTANGGTIESIENPNLMP